MRKYILFLSLLCLSLTAAAKVRLPALLADNMVMQRDAQVRLWGEAGPNKDVVIRCPWLTDDLMVRSDAAGRWIAHVATPAAGGSYSITFDDGERTTLRDVMMGDVWLCSGQSNMEMTMTGKPGQGVNGALHEILTAPSVKDIRIFNVEYKESDVEVEYCQGEWVLPSCESVAKVSAVAYYFARHIQAATGVPIGLMINIKGGSSIISWLSESSLYSAVSKKQVAEIIGDEHRRHRYPSVLHNGMIKPIENCSFKGVLWYQGETNIAFPQYYEPLMCELVESWRAMWARDNQPLPFYFVQMAPNDYAADGGADGVVRPMFVEAQKRVEAIMDDCYMATTTDIGDAYYLHPPQKDVVAERLAALAVKYTYGVEALDADYPSFEEVDFEDGYAYVKMESPMGLMPRQIVGFEIAGKDRVFHKAEAVVEYKKAIVKVYSPNVPKPVAVRYAFRNTIEANMTNTLGIAAVSFRSDNW